MHRRTNKGETKQTKIARDGKNDTKESNLKGRSERCAGDKQEAVTQADLPMFLIMHFQTLRMLVGKI